MEGENRPRKYKDIKELRRDWDMERKYLRETRERELEEALEWKNERDRLRVQVRQLEEYSQESGPMIGDGQTSLPTENVGKIEETSHELEHEKEERGEETGETRTPQDSRDQSGETSMVLPSTKTRDRDTHSESRRRATLAADEASQSYQTNPSTTSPTGDPSQQSHYQ